jgi:PAS domain S-box-containing protein
MTGLLQDLAEMTDGVVAVDENQRILLWNKAAEKLLKISAKKALGRYCYEIICGRDEAGTLLCRQTCRTMALATRGKPIPPAELFTVTPRGRQLWLNVSHFVPRSIGTRITLVHIFRDISRQKATENLVRQLSTALDGFGLRAAPSTGPQDLAAQLSRRERQVLQLLAKGVSTSAIGEQLHISRFTVRNHVQTILSKLDAHTRAEAVALAALHQLL